MRPVSDALLRTVQSSHVARFRATVMDDYQEGTDPAGTVIPILAGNVTLDASAEVRGTLDMSTDPALWPGGPGDLVTPYGNTVYVQRGVEVAGGSIEWVGLGYFRMYSVGQSGAPLGQVRLTGQDRMSGIKDAQLLSPRQFNPAATVNSFLNSLIHEVYPASTITCDFDPLAFTLDRTIVVETDRYGALLDMARSLGKVMYWDHAGVFQLKTPPDPGVGVYQVHAGPGGVLINLDRELSREGMVNAVVATGEAPDNKPPVRGVAKDMNPVSPTFWSGTFGQVPRFYSSAFITKNAQARTAARVMLSRTLGLPYQVDMSLVPNPALEPLDPLDVALADGRREIHVLQSLTIGLTATEAMSATTKDQTDQNIETEDGDTS